MLIGIYLLRLLKIYLGQYWFRSRILLSLLASFLFALNIQVARAQLLQLTATVVDATSREPLIGALVRVVEEKGVENAEEQMRAVTTDANGTFALALPAGTLLEISYLGYGKQRVRLTDGAVYALKVAAGQLGEAVVTAGVKSRQENVAVTSSADVPGVTLALNTFRAQDGLVISEIFFAGTLTPEGKQYSDDQYFKIGNNSDSTIYLDGLAIVESDFLTVQKQDYKPNIMDKAMTVDAVYCIPGDGTEHPLAPGEEVVLALNAKNHLEFNSKSIDLSKADFEFYDVSSNPSFQDEDNPNVPNLVNWYDYSASYFALHNRGFKSYAIGRPTCDVETFMRDYIYTYTYVFTYGKNSFNMDDEAYKFPNDWIIDAVNLSVESEFQWIVTSPSLDAGWTHCGSVDKDQNRYGKAVVRKKENGKWVDTNNSTNDFEADAVPTLMK